MAIEFNCPSCDAPLEASDDLAGETGKCPKCESPVTIPDPPEPTAAG